MRHWPPNYPAGHEQQVPFFSLPQESCRVWAEGNSTHLFAQAKKKKYHFDLSKWLSAQLFGYPRCKLKRQTHSMWNLLQQGRCLSVKWTHFQTPEGISVLFSLYIKSLMKWAALSWRNYLIDFWNKKNYWRLRCNNTEKRKMLELSKEICKYILSGWES